MDILFGLLIGLVGIGLAFAGLRVFFVMLPALGFVAGFFTGAWLIANWLGDGFLSTVGGWIAGLVLGVLFAIVSYLWWYAGALFGAGYAGSLLLSGIFSIFGVDNGTALTIAAITGAVLFIIVAVVIHLPVYIVLINTALVGAHMLIVGLLLIFNRIVIEQLDWGVARAITQENWFWWIVMIVVASFGIFFQLRIVDRIVFPEDRWTRGDQT